MMRHSRRRVVAIATTLASMLIPAAIASAASPDQIVDEGNTIVVTGYRPRDLQFGDLPPIDQLTEVDIAGYGLGTFSDLMGELMREGAGDQALAPIVLVNGRKVASLSEVANLPTESIRRVEVLQEQVALRYGGSAGQKVINVVLRSQFRSATASLATSLATEGGGHDLDGSFALTRISGNNRLSLSGRMFAADALLESERGIRPTPTGFDVLGNVIAAPGSGSDEIDPALSAVTGMRVTVAGVPSGVERPGIADFASTANVPNVSDLGRFRTLRPDLRRYSLNGTIARELSGSIKVSLDAGGNYETSRSRNGLPTATLLLPASNPYSPFSNDVAIARYLGQPLEQTTRGVGSYLGLSVTADLGRWELSMTGEYGHRWTRTRTDRGIDTEQLQARLMAGDPALNPFGPLPASLLGDRLSDLARSSAGTGSVVFDGSGPLLKVPAGDVRVSVRADLTRSFLSARLTRSNLTETGERRRTDAGGWLNVEVPITSRDKKRAGGLGDLSGFFSAGIRSVSDMRTLHSLGYGLSWAPRAGISLTASLNKDRQPPSLVQLASPIIETRGIRLFDYVSGETVELTRVSGGNPALLSYGRRTFKLGVNLLPLGAGKLRISADYLRIRTDDPIAALPAATATIQAAFPERFVRDVDNTLVRVDSRPVNFAREDREQLRWGFVFRRTHQARRTASSSGAATATEGNARKGSDSEDGLNIHLSLYHTWVFKDDILLRPGVPVLDLLHGGSAGSNGGQPRHELQWELGANRRGLGARLIGDWWSGTFVRGGSVAAADRLRFSPLMRLDLHLFADFGDRFPSAAWARNFRLSLTIANLLNNRQHVRDSRGATPFSYQPAYLDPLGRTISLSLRKQLS